MEFTVATRVLRALLVHQSDSSVKRYMASTALGAFLALLAFSPLAMTEAQAAPEVGALPGSANVSATGAATYTIPIQLPPGTNGMQPSLALVYNSQSGDGLAGYGWTLSGLSAISRCSKNPEDDSISYNIPVQNSTTSTSSDDFCLDGQRLRLVSGTYYGANLATYGKEIEDFSLVTSYAPYPPTGPLYFTVQTKDGRTYEYGNTSDSYIMASGTYTARTWLLDKVTDANGNYIKYTYASPASPAPVGIEYWPVSIDYTGNGTTAPDHHILFDFESKTAMVMGRYTAGSFSQTSKMLHDIKVNYGSTTTFMYYLNYVVDGGGGRDTLTTVQQCSGTTTGNCLPATTIAWNPSAAGWQSKVNTGITVINLGRAKATKLMDVDGDGIRDLVYPSSHWMVAFGQPGGGFGTPVNTGIGVVADPTYFGNALAMDYNGDGCMDMIVPTSSGVWTVMISQCTQTGAVFSTSPDNNAVPAFTQVNSQTNNPMFEGNLSVGSFHGDGITDIFDNTGAFVQLRKNYAPPSDGAFSGWTNLISISGQDIAAPGYVDVGLDFDGSGRAGALAYLTSGSWAAYVPSGGSAVTQMDTAAGNSNPAIPLDLNGDGSTDILMSDTANQWEIQLSTGVSFHQLLYNLYEHDLNADPILADYYGNGTQVAIVYAGSSSGTHWYILHPTPNGTGGYSVTSTTLTQGIYPFNTNYGGGTLRVGNISSYGLSDLVYALNNGDSTFTFYYQLHNFTPGLYPDVVNKITDGLGNVIQFSYKTLSDGSPTYTKNVTYSYPIHGIQTPMPVAATMTSTNGSGASYNLAYTYANAEIDVKGHGFLGFGSRTVTDSRNTNKEIITYDQTFPFTGMVIQDLLQKSTGDKITETDDTDADQVALPAGPDGSQRYFPFFDTNTRTDYDFIHGTVHAVRVTVTTQSTASFDSYGNVLNGTTVVTDDTQPGDPTYTTTITATYAPRGSIYCVNLPATMTTTVSRSSPVENGSRNVIYKDDTDTCRVQSQTLSPGTTGGGTPSVTTSYSSFDTFGNVTEVDVTGTGLAGTRTTKFSYAGGNNEFPTTVTRVVSTSPAVNLVRQAAWDYSLGVQLSSTDPNNNLTTTAYDAFGRPITVTRADLSGATIAYALCPGAGTTYCPSGAAYEIADSAFNNLSGSGYASIITGYTAYDSWGRPIEQGRVPLGGVSNMSRVDTTYDLLGEPLTVTKPFLPSGTVYTASFTYDLAMGRVTEVSQPQDETDLCAGIAPTPCNNNTDYTYSGFTVTASQSVTNSASSTSTHTTTSTRDAIGEMLNVTDSNDAPTGAGLTSYGYDAFGDLTSTTDADGKLTTISYDGLGHKTGMADPNMGTWMYQVDALGETTCQTDAKFQSIVLGYDAVGRLTVKTETVPKSGPDCSPVSADVAYTGTWSYDAATKGLGLPASVSDSNGFLRTYEYDTVSRPRNVNTTPGTSAPTYTMTNAYDNFGRIGSVTYPATVSGTSRFQVNYNYDPASGALNSVSDAASEFVYWQVAPGGIDAFGQILAYVDGNNVSTVTAYDEATGAVTGLGTGIGSSSSIQQLAYSWDGFGNLKQRCDANRGLVENFTFDGLNRLSTSKVYSGGTPGSCTQGATAGAAMGLTYDAIGNIQTRANTGITVGSGTQNDTYAYGDPNHPYAVTGVTSIPGSYGYDANGNMSSGNGRTISWNADNLPTNITAAGGSSSFSYDPENQRYGQTATGSNGTVATTYVGGLFEVVTASGDTQYRHNIVASGGLVAVHTIDQSGVASTTYVHADHLGSADVLTDDTGHIAVDPATGQQQVSSFDAFGLRRNPADWSYNLSSIQVAGLKAFTDKGYTSQEQLDNVGLVHMNGRVYDPGIGRMTSADPKIPGGFNGQAFDRYTYVYDQPLSMIDPTGFDGAGSSEAGLSCSQGFANTGSHLPTKLDSGGAGATVECPNGDPSENSPQNGGDGGGGGCGASAGACLGTVSVTCNPSVSVACMNLLSTQIAVAMQNYFNSAMFSVIPGMPGFRIPTFKLPPALQPLSLSPTLPPQSPVPGPTHEYQIHSGVLCSAGDAFNQFKAPGMSAPGAPAAVEGFTPQINLEGNNPISQLVNSSTMTITNTTLPGHVFYSPPPNVGQVVIQVTPDTAMSSFVTITGTGSSSDPTVNDATGYAFFGSVLGAVSYGCAVQAGTASVGGF